MNYYYCLRFNDGILNKHESIIKQVKLLQNKLKDAHCFNDLKIDGKYGEITLKAIYLMKRRIHLPINDSCDRYLWAYLMNTDLSNIILIPKPNHLKIPKQALEILKLPEATIEGTISNLIAIPCFNLFSENQILALTLFSYRTGYYYGCPDFKAINSILKMKALSRIPDTLMLYSNQHNKEQRLQEISFWNLD